MSFNVEHRGSVSSNSSVKNIMRTAYNRWQEHNNSVQQAWEAHYGYPTTAATYNTSRNGSASSADSLEPPKNKTSISTKVKKAFREHHQSVQGSFEVLYGAGYNSRA